MLLRVAVSQVLIHYDCPDIFLEDRSIDLNSLAYIFRTLQPH